MNAFKFVDRLEETGFTRKQSEESMKVWLEMMDENLVTKRDILEVRSEMKDIVHEMKQMESRLTIKLGKIVFTGISVLGIVLGIIIKS